MFEPQPLFPLPLVQRATHARDGPLQRGRQPALERMYLPGCLRQRLAQAANHHFARRGIEQEIGQPLERTRRGCSGGTSGSWRCGARGERPQQRRPRGDPGDRNAPQGSSHDLELEYALRPSDRAQSRPAMRRERCQQQGIRASAGVLDLRAGIRGGSRELKQLGDQRLALAPQQRRAARDLSQAARRPQQVHAGW